MQPPSPRGPGAGALVLAFVAGALGGVSAALLLSPRAPAAGCDDDGAGLRPSIAALDESVRVLGEQVARLGRLPAAPPSPSEPLSVPPSGDDAVRDPVDVALVLGRLDDIAKLLQSRMAMTANGFSGSAPLPPLDAARPPSDRSALIALATAENDQSRQLWRRHAFWTCQQVLDAYGLPDQIEAGDGLMGWYYQTSERTLHFEFYEGMLINLWN